MKRFLDVTRKCLWTTWWIALPFAVYGASKEIGEYVRVAIFREGNHYEFDRVSCEALATLAGLVVAGLAVRGIEQVWKNQQEQQHVTTK